MDTLSKWKRRRKLALSMFLYCDQPRSRFKKTTRIKKPRRVTSRIPILEINRIREDRLSRNMIYRENKKKKLSNIVTIENNNKEENDLISGLPDDILLSILSRLSLREAILTSVLSRRWRQLWRSTPFKKLEFNIMDMPWLLPNAFVRWVDKNLASLQSVTKIDSFRVDRYLPTKKYRRKIDRWIQVVVDKKVQNLDLNLTKTSRYKWRSKSPNPYKYWTKPYSFPHWLFTKPKEPTLKHLSLTYCQLSILPPNFNGFSSLISLTLKETFVSEENLLNILSTCSSLQWLSMESCSCSRRLTFASGGSCSSLKLKHLNICRCRFLKEVDISEAENLISFDYAGDMLSHLLCNNNVMTNSVKRLSLRIVRSSQKWTDYALLGGLASDFPHIETLLLTLPHAEVSTNLPTFIYLRQLVLILLGEHSENLRELTSTILKASPLLDKLELHFPIPIGEIRQIEEILSSDSFRHENLKEVVIYNFGGQAREVELIMDLVNCAISVEKIQINRGVSVYQGDGEWLSYHSSIENKRHQIFQMLYERLPKAIDLQVL